MKQDKGLPPVRMRKDDGKIGKKLLRRLPAALLLLAAAVAAGCYLVPAGFVGPQSEVWQRLVFVAAVLGLGAAGLGSLLGWKGALAGFGCVLLIALVTGLQKLLPDPYNRYFAFLYMAALLVGTLLMRRRQQKARDAAQAAPQGEAGQDADGADFDPDSLIVLDSLRATFFQLFRCGNELRLYRVGGELRGVDPGLLQSSGSLRAPGRKDKVLRIGEELRVEIVDLPSGSRYGEEALKLRGGGRFTLYPVGDPEAFHRFVEKNLRRQGAAVREPAESSLPAPKPERVALLRKIRNGLIVAAICIDLPWLFLKVPYRLFAVLALLVPLSCLVLCCLFPYETTLFDSKKSEKSKASFLLLLLLSSNIILLRALLDFDFLDWKKLLLSAGIVFAVLLAALLAFTREWREKKSLILVFAFLLLLLAFGLTAELNYIADRAEPELQSAVVVDMHISSGSRSPDTYKLELRLPDGGSMTLTVGKSRYERTRVGDRVKVLIFPGALGIPYAAVA